MYETGRDGATVFHQDGMATSLNNMNQKKDLWPALLLIVFLMLQAVVFARNTPLSYPPDEVPHLSYVWDSINSTYLLPNYGSGTILGFGQPNYLSHPPLYYSILGAAGKLFSLDPKLDYFTFRLFSVAFFGLALFFSVLTADRLGMERSATYISLFACSAIPMVGYLAGSVNNDALLYLGFAITFYGMARVASDPRQNLSWSLFFIVLGLLIVFLTKATGMAMLVFFGLIYAVLNWRHLRDALATRSVWIALAVFLAVTGGYYAFTYLTYHSLFPKAGNLYQATVVENPMSFQAYAMDFYHSMTRRFPIIFSHLSVAPIHEKLTTVFFAMLGLPLAGWMVMRFSPDIAAAKRPLVKLFDALAMAIALMLAIHIYLGYRAYTQAGVLSGFQPRYYLFLIPLVWFPFFSLCRPGWFKQLMTGAFALLSVIVFWSSVPFTQQKQYEALLDLGPTFEYTERTYESFGPLRFALRQEVEGNVDELTIEDGVLRARGWVFDTVHHARIQRLWVLAREDYITSIKPYSQRPDVAKALGVGAAVNSGFAFAIKNLPRDLTPCDIHLLVEFHDETMGNLKPAQCTN
jgi:4-amino-4-deoxy-L-arabinose transferase-like glycosyltransferase